MSQIDSSASYLDLHLDIDSEGWLKTNLYNKRADFNFPIVNFPFICSNILAAPAYGVYISQLIRYSRACGSYQDFLDRRLLLTRKPLSQGFPLVKLKSSLRKFYGRHLVDRYGISVSQMTIDMFHLLLALLGPFLIHDLLPALLLD
jgi:hypothetical protein